MSNYKYIYLPISYLEKENISKKDFLENSPETQDFLKKLTNKISPFTEIHNIFLVSDEFILVTKNKSNIIFENQTYFNKFKDFILNSNFKKHINFDDKKREISINSDTPPIFYNILYEFLV